jgi:hypothetical protein
MILNKDIIEEILNNDIKVTGVLHIGAHECEEIPIYYNLGLKLEDMIWIDANNDKVKEAKNRNIPNVYEAVIANEDDIEKEFHVANNIESSSLLDLGTHKKDYPHIKYIRSFIAKTITIKTFFKRNKIVNPEKYNFWNFDIQGAELMALQGAGDLIKNIKVINVEVNTKQVYKGCPLISDIDNYLSKYGFKRILTKITPQGWGDALYIIPKKQIYIYNNNTFGDKIFNLIYGIYLYNLYKGQCKINYVIANSKHTIEDEKYLDIVFPDSKTKINFIKYDELTIYNKNIIKKILSSDNSTHSKTYNSNTYNTLREFPKYEELKDINCFNDCFQLTYKMYETFDKQDIDIFQNINKSLITDEQIYQYENLNYILLDVRYDNKLICNIDNKINTQDNKFIIYSPQYYIDTIYNLNNNNLFYLIITNNKEYVLEYILQTKITQNNYIFIDANSINSFYLYYNAKYIIMTNNTFSMAGAYFNMSNINDSKINYLLYRDKHSNYSLPEEKAISDKWIISNEKKYILNYDTKLIEEICNFIANIKRNKNSKKKINNNVIYLNNNNKLLFIYQNKTEINYFDYLYDSMIKTKLFYIKFILNPVLQKLRINKFYEEIYFDKLLNDYNIKSCIFLTKDIYSSYIKRLFEFSNLKIFNLYVNEKNDKSNYDKYKPLSNYINKEIKNYESLILFLLKNDYGVEYDFIFDYYMFKINEFLNTVKNMKLLIISYTPNLILPFTLNTLINICNHSENYKIVYINNYIFIIFNNIKNYNINLKNIKYQFIQFYKIIETLSNEDILKEIAYSQFNNNSIGSSYYYKFNNYTKIDNKDIKDEIDNYKYKIKIINFPLNVNNDKFKIDLLINIYQYYDDDKYDLNLFTFHNYHNQEIYENYHHKNYNNWIKLIYGNTIEKNKIKLSIKSKKTLKSIKKTINKSIKNSIYKD